MDIETSNAIRLFFPNPSLSLVFFEAIANAFDANATEIKIDINLTSFDASESLKVTIEDNGNGFTDENFDRFKSLLKPRDKYHKGVGRLVFLNYFNQVEVNSTLENQVRSFIFKDKFDGSYLKNETTNKNNKTKSTKLTFTGFSNKQIKSYDDIKPDTLKKRIIEHFLPMLSEFNRTGKKFIIKISLETLESNATKDFFTKETTIKPEDLPTLSVINISNIGIDAISTIEMHYHIQKTREKSNLLTAVCIDGRTIPINLIQSSAIPFGYSVVFLFVSEFFHAKSDSSRQKLSVPYGINENRLYKMFRNEISTVLSKEIPEINKENVKVKKQFEKKFPHLLGYFDENTVGLIDKDEALNNANQQLFSAQKELLQCDKMDDATFKKYLDISSRALTEYILYREGIIEKMKGMTESNSEADLHNLIVPRYQEYRQEKMTNDIYQNNAWLLDDKFMTFRTVLSEAEMGKVINAISLTDDDVEENGRPDIAMIFSADPNDQNPVDVVIVEIKKKTDNEKENIYAVNQLLDRAQKLVDFCPNIQRVWYYALIQVNETLSNRLRQMKWAPLFSKGKVFYQEFETYRKDSKIVPTPTFIMSFDALVSDAESRNHAFLEVLRNTIKEHVALNSNATVNKLEVM